MPTTVPLYQPAIQCPPMAHLGHEPVPDRWPLRGPKQKPTHFLSGMVRDGYGATTGAPTTRLALYAIFFARNVAGA